jgi:probable rRNA maturation factor
VAIEIANRQRLIPVDRLAITRLVRSVLAATAPAVRGEALAKLTIAFVRDKTIRYLNRVYRGTDRVTDVLSFHSLDSGSDSGGYLGDIVISADTAVRQASEGHHPVEREVNELVIHGVLHLCGYDHETDAGEMDRLELRLRRKLLSASALRGAAR